MNLQVASRKRVKIKMALQGPSGAGKTYSSLLLAYGLCQDWTKIAVIDTENSSADLYADLGAYNTLGIFSPFTPEKYIEAISFCEKENIQVIIIDSLSHEWNGSGGVLDMHSCMTGNSFTNWSKLTPRHNAFIQAILQSPSHIIGTIRSKQDYILTEKNGKQVPEKIGLKGIIREGTDYEFALVFDVNMKHQVTVSKDRTGLFTGQPEFIITPGTGQKIEQWCNSGIPVTADDVTARISDCISINELLQIYREYPQFKKLLLSRYEQRKKQLILSQSKQAPIIHQPIYLSE